MKTDADELPDLAVGRIIGNDQAAVGNAVNKIISYENSPPTGAWRRRATIAAQFQDDDVDGRENRTFITFAETLRTGLVNAGNTVDRVYDDSPTATPLKFNDGTDLPAELKKPTFAWDGDGADVTAAWNEGRFLMVHRDHGWSDGWGHPGFGTTDVQALTNGNLLPVMMSINCSSAAYDYDETSFVGEALVKANGGVVGAFGDTRDSPTWHNTQIGLGFADALLPGVLPAEGPGTRQRVGDALIHGKMRLAGMAPPASDGSTRNELYLWHYFGDPTMQMWGGRREFNFDVSQFAAVFQQLVEQPPPGDPPPFWVIVNVPPGLNGETLSIFRNGEVLGKAVVTGDTVRIPASLADGSKPVGQLQVALDGEGAPPILIDVKNEPAATLAQSCPADDQFNSNDEVTVTGKLSGAPAGSTVDVTWEMPDRNEPGGRTVVTHPVTDAQGNWTTTVQSQSFEYGNWSVSSSYAGGGGYGPSQAGPCTFHISDNS
jgi:hypothetical protein